MSAETEIVQDEVLPPFLRTKRSQNGVKSTTPAAKQAAEPAPPELSIVVCGEVISSNAAEFMAKIREGLAAINRDPKTDEEFAQAKADVGNLDAAEKSIAAAKAKALEDAGELHALFSTLDDGKEEIRQARLELEKMLKAKTEEVKTKALDEVMEEFSKAGFPHAADANRSFVRSMMSGKRTLVSMRESMRVGALTKIGEMKKSRAAIEKFEAEHGPDMTRDRDALEQKSPDTVAVELKRRADLKVAEAARKEAEEAARKAREEAAAAMASAVAASVGTAPPEPAKVAPLPASASGPGDDTTPGEEEELAAFDAALVAAFGPVRAAKAALKHPANIERVALFSAAVGEARKNNLLRKP